MIDPLLLTHKKNWLLYLRSVRRLATHSINAYSDDFDQWVRFFTEYYNESLTIKRFEAILITDIRAWASERQKSNLNIRSTARALAAIKNFVRFSIQENVFISHILLDFRLGRITKQLPRPITATQAVELINSISSFSNEPWVGARDEALITLLYSTGLRISEALSLTINSIKRDFLIVLGKGGKTRHVPLMQNVKAAIDAYLVLSPYTHGKNNDNDLNYVFRGTRGGQMSPSIVQKKLRDYRHMYGLPHTTTPHSLRHSCATHLVESSADLRAIQDLLGHASLSSTQLYTDVAQKHIHAIFKRTHPRQKI